MKEELVASYVEDTSLSLAKDWYEYTLKPDWDYVVFIVRRAYLMAQIMEEILDRKMEEESDACFLTDAAILARSHDLAEFYLKYGRLPNILICEDCLVHGRNINHFLDRLSNEIWYYIQNRQENEVKEETFQTEFVRAIKLHMIIKPDQGLLLLERYMLKVHCGATRTVKELHDFSHQISNLISRSGKANVSYVYADTISSLKKELYGYTTRYWGIEEHANIKLIRQENRVKGIMTLRMIDMPGKNYRMIPFVFLPDLSRSETDNLWNYISEKFLDYNGTNNRLERYMDQLKQLKDTRSFDELLTLIISAIWLENAYAQTGVRAIESKPEDYRIIARNYNISNLEETEDFLKYVRQTTRKMAKEQPMNIEKLLTESLDEESYILEVGEEQTQEMQESAIVLHLEEYWQEIAADEEMRARLVAENPVFYSENKSLRHTHNCGEMLKQLFQGRTEKEICIGIAYFLQMMDGGIVSVSSYGSGENENAGFIQRAKAGEMSLLIYPGRMKEYIPLLAQIYNYCDKRELEWWKVAIKYCNSDYSGMSPEEIEEVQKFIKYLYVYDQNPDEWDIYYGNDVVNDKENEIQQMNRKLKLVFSSYEHWNGFERYVREVLMK